MVDTALATPGQLQMPSVQGASLVGRWVVLEPIQPRHLDFLYRLATDGETGYRWRLRGTVPSFESFQAHLWQGVLSQFVLCRKGTGAPIGQVLAYNANPNAGHAALGVVVIPEMQRRGLAIDGMSLFINYLFTTYSFRKLYFEVPEYNLEQFGGSLRSRLEEEGRLKENDYYAGRYWDTFVYALWRPAVDPER